MQVLGHLAAGTRLLRSGARPGDRVFVSGTLGDGAAGLGLVAAGEQHAATVAQRYLRDRFLRPEPRVELGLALARVATAAIDVSDGLIADLSHICEASGVAADIQSERLPLSTELLACCGREKSEELALSGGDDYELCFTLPAGARLAADGFCEIGVITAGAGVRVLERGRPRPPRPAGYRHFGDDP